MHREISDRNSPHAVEERRSPGVLVKHIRVLTTLTIVMGFCGCSNLRSSQHVPARENAPTCAVTSDRESYRPYIDSIAQTLIQSATPMQNGLMWLNIPQKDSPEETQFFYDGNAGIVYFLLK